MHCHNEESELRLQKIKRKMLQRRAEQKTRSWERMELYFIFRAGIRSLAFHMHLNLLQFQTLTT